MATTGMTAKVLERRIREYEAFGIHRTGWPGDEASAMWMRSELQTAAIDVSLEEFEYPMFRSKTAWLSWDGGEITGVPLHDCGLTGPKGVSGQVVMAGVEDVSGKIVVAGANEPEFAATPPYEMIARLEKSGAAGLVLVRCDSLGAINLSNAYRIDDPFNIPVLQVACPDATGLSVAARNGTSATLTVDATRESGTALNVSATLPGENGDAAPLGIMTPRSGWFTCASERGGGIAIWLGLAEAIASMTGRRRTVHIVASSGHEIDHYGLQAYLNSRPELARNARAWLHLGALIGSRAAPVRVEPSDEELKSLAESAFAASGADRWAMWDRKGGEAKNIAAAGGRYVSLRGGPSTDDGDTYSHSPNDTFDRASDIELVAASGRACLSMIEKLDAI
ncbi:MAG: hypothetical protein O3C10_05295 [Chloroflexi bacterium]|nr:hypothetical protein [Chloroflexota bacterium]